MPPPRSEEHTSELQSRRDLVCRLLLEKKKLAQVARRRVRPVAQLGHRALHRCAAILADLRRPAEPQRDQGLRQHGPRGHGGDRRAVSGHAHRQAWNDPQSLSRHLWLTSHPLRALRTPSMGCEEAERVRSQPEGPAALTFGFFFNNPATAEIYTLSLHDALPI